MRAARVAGIVAIAFALAACGGDDEEAATAPTAAATSEHTTTEIALPEVEGMPPTTSSLAGTWSLFGERLLWRFTEDGAFAFDRENPDAPYASGTYGVEGKTITFTAKGPACTDTWAWEAAIEEAEGEDPLDDELHVVFRDPACGRIARTQWTFGRLAPE